MTASAGSVVKNFALQLNAAIFALSINATSVAFGDVVGQHIGHTARDVDLHRYCSGDDQRSNADGSGIHSVGD
jgi:hypothetical protein